MLFDYAIAQVNPPVEMKENEVETVDIGSGNTIYNILVAIIAII